MNKEEAIKRIEELRKYVQQCDDDNFKFKVGDIVKFKSESSINAKYFERGLSGLQINNRFSNDGDFNDYEVWESDKSSVWSVFEDELELDNEEE